MNSYREILANLNETIAYNPNDIRAIAQRGDIYRLLKQYEEALADLSRAVGQNPIYVWAIARRGKSTA